MSILKILLGIAAVGVLASLIIVWQTTDGPSSTTHANYNRVLSKDEITLSEVEAIFGQLGRQRELRECKERSDLTEYWDCKEFNRKGELWEGNGVLIYLEFNENEVFAGNGWFRIIEDIKRHSAVVKALLWLGFDRWGGELAKRDEIRREQRVWGE